MIVEPCSKSVQERSLFGAKGDAQKIATFRQSCRHGNLERLDALERLRREENRRVFLVRMGAVHDLELLTAPLIRGGAALGHRHACALLDEVGAGEHPSSGCVGSQ